MHSQILPVRAEVIMDVELTYLTAVFIEDVLTNLAPGIWNFLILKSTIWSSICFIIEDFNDELTHNQFPIVWVDLG